MELGSRRIYTTMPSKLRSSLPPRILLISLILFLVYSTILLRRSITPNLVSPPPCDLFSGRWVFNPETPKPMYDETCPFHRNAWNCLRNKRENMGVINSWRWVPDGCGLSRIDPTRFLGLMRNKNIGLVGDSLNENFLVSLLCILRVADPSVVKWKKKKAWRGAYFPKFNVTVAYHRAVLLAKYQWQPRPSAEANQDGVKGTYRVDVDVPADEWINVTSFYDVLIFNSGHWWGYDKFPKETPLVFYLKGKPISPPLDILQGFEVVLQHMVSYIHRQVPAKTLKFWRLQSPRHFYGGDINNSQAGKSSTVQTSAITLSQAEGLALTKDDAVLSPNTFTQKQSAQQYWRPKRTHSKEAEERSEPLKFNEMSQPLDQQRSSPIDLQTDKKVKVQSKKQMSQDRTTDPLKTANRFNVLSDLSEED